MSEIRFIATAGGGAFVEQKVIPVQLIHARIAEIDRRLVELGHAEIERDSLVRLLDGAVDVPSRSPRLVCGVP